MIDLWEDYRCTDTLVQNEKEEKYPNTKAAQGYEEVIHSKANSNDQ